MNKAQAIHSFWSSFGLTAYDENSVPADAQLPYITYNFIDSSFDTNVYLTASLWYRSTSWEEITAKANNIGQFISRSGCDVSYDDGYAWVRKGDPFYQRMSDASDDLIRRIYMNVIVEYVSKD